MQYYFQEPRLQLTAAGESLARLLSGAFYASFTAASVMLLLSDVPAFRSLSALFALFLIDRLIHVGEAEKSLNEIRGEHVNPRTKKFDARVNLAYFVSPSAERILSQSLRKSRILGRNFHLVLLYELLKRKDILKVFERLDISVPEFTEKLNEIAAKAQTALRKNELLTLVEFLVIAAFENARATGERFIEPRNLLVAALGARDEAVMEVINFFDLDPKDAREAVIYGRYAKQFARIRRLPSVLGGFAHQSRYLRKRVMNRAWTARPTPTLDAFSTDLTNLARREQIGFLIGHEKEFNHLLAAISRPGKPNALLVGAPGSGKSTMIAHLAYRIVKDEVPNVLFDKRLVSLNVSELVANAPPDVLSGRIDTIIKEILTAGNVVLFIPDVHNLFRTSEAGAVNAIDLLLPIVRSEAIPLIAETYPREFKRYIEPRSDFLDQFEVINVEEISEEEAVRFSVYSGLILERQFNITVSFRAVKKAVELAHRYFRNKPLPGSAVDLLKQSLTRAAQEGARVLHEKNVIDTAEEISKIPIEKAGKAEAEKLLNLETIIHERLINQDEAVKAVSRALREYRSGLSRRGGPIATFLFVGPTGVGKTELSKILARIQFGSKDAMVRFDMSEYQDKQSIFRMIGTPDGEKTGSLTDAILEKPYSLILLDEFEKANEDVLNLFLQVFDDGRLTDSLNRTVDFQNTIIIATSNAHSDFIKESVEAGKTVTDISEELKRKLTAYFKPELLNRFSDIIVFRSLKKDEIQRIAAILIAEFGDLLKEEQGIELLASDEALQKLAELGYDPVYGARPLRQAISENVRSRLAEMILKNEVKRGDTVWLMTRNNEIHLEVTK